MQRTASLLCLSLLVTAACASGDESPDTVEPSGGGADPGSLGPLEAPFIEEVIPTSKVLRIRWTLPSSCDQVEGERRTDAQTFAPAFTAEGTDTDYVDEDANENLLYTYRLRCARGNATSDWSETMSGNPFLP